MQDKDSELLLAEEMLKSRIHVQSVNSPEILAQQINAGGGNSRKAVTSCDDNHEYVVITQEAFDSAREHNMQFLDREISPIDAINSQRHQQ